MHRRLLLFSVLLFPFFAPAQTSKLSKPPSVSKPPIDTTAIFNWPYLNNDCAISPNGNYIMYRIFNQPRGRNTLVLQSTNDTSWKKQMVDAASACFSSDEKQAVYSKDDTLFFLSLPTGQVKTVTGVKSYRQPRVEKGTWLAYQLKGDAKETVLLNLVTGEEQRFTSVDDYSFSDNGRTLLIKQNNQTIASLQWVNLETKKASTIWTGQPGMQLIGYNFDLAGDQLVFITKTQTGNTIWYYRDGINSAAEKINNRTEGIASGLQISADTPFFNKSGKYIFFKLQKPVETPKPDPNTVDVDVWSYKDVRLIPEQSKQPMPKIFTSVMAVAANKIVQVEQEGEQIAASGGQNIQYSITCDYLIVATKKEDFFWNWNQARPYYVVSLKDGSKKLLKNDWIREFIYSPTGRFIIYYDAKQGQFLACEVTAGVTRNITKNIPEKLQNEYKQYVPGRTYPIAVGIAGWFENDDALMIYDNYDIWKVDPLGKLPPVNMTNGYGKKHHVKFKLLYDENVYRQTVYSEQEPFLLSAFGEGNKYNGFFRVQPSKKGDPDLLAMEPCFMHRKGSQIRNDDAFDAYGGMEPLKASNKPIWLIRRQTATEAPNFYVTGDLKSYKQLTNIQPQKDYNWLTADLITYKQVDGTNTQGILYKPEDFDAAKKYPVIFSYYETFSYRMYEFPKPGLSTARIDIAWYVSRGYLVFTPDIHYSIASISGKVVGDHAVNSIVGAAQYLSKLPYVDGKRMGIQGHSFGGGETLYLITHSHLFAAAQAAASTVSNEISAYLGIRQPNGMIEGEFRLSHAEIGHDMIGATLWGRPDLYIKASPIFRADKVTTPLLIMHNHGDGATDWGQSIEMYMALRRLQKPVWMLQYDNEDHQIGDRKKALDFTIRMNQFFDHYLKGAPAPKWMTRGIPAALKGIESRLELDSSKNGF